MNDKDRSLTDRGVENNLEGKGTELKGRLKDAVGGLTGDSSTQAEGKLDQAKGKIQNAFGNAQRKLDSNG